MSKPLAIDLFCGLGGWTEGLLAEGYRVVGFDIERHSYPLRNTGLDELKTPAGNNAPRHWKDRQIARLSDATKHIETTGWAEYPAQLVIQDVLTLDGAQFKDAALIVASPPCQAYSYRAMPWKRAKALPPPDNTLFEACFRIQREAIAAAGRFIPLVVENVCGAQKWVGRARWHHGSFYLWGDVPALMPIVRKSIKVPMMGAGWYPPDHPKHVAGLAFNGHAERNLRAHNTTSGHGHNPDGRKTAKNGGPDYGGGFGWDGSPMRQGNSKSSARKAASAHIAKIPLPLSRHIARAWHPEGA